MQRVVVVCVWGGLAGLAFARYGMVCVPGAMRMASGNMKDAEIPFRVQQLEVEY